MFSSKWKLPLTVCLAVSDIFNPKLEGLEKVGQQVIDPRRPATQASTESRHPKEGPPRQNGQGWKICTCSLNLAGSRSAAAFACSLQLTGILIRWRYKLDGWSIAGTERSLLINGPLISYQELRFRSLATPATPHPALLPHIANFGSDEPSSLLYPSVLGHESKATFGRRQIEELVCQG